ncbi:hypothetical protein [Guyparkeria sp.]|uniref:hypothetical protein n=1 Tax=Guyparkeria sp. TaxID=2035736 RepID=UPI00397095BC
MALRVDREAALGWLGIEGFRPSGRVRPARFQSPVEGEGPTTDAPVEASDETQPGPTGAQVDTLADVSTPARDGADDEPRREAPVAEPPPVPAEPTDEVLPDRLCIAADSPYRALAEAIAQVAGLACETGEGGDTVTLRGETWELATLAGDGAAKRRLWRTIVARGRRARG